MRLCIVLLNDHHLLLLFRHNVSTVAVVDGITTFVVNVWTYALIVASLQILMFLSLAYSPVDGCSILLATFSDNSTNVLILKCLQCCANVTRPCGE